MHAAPRDPPPALPSRRHLFPLAAVAIVGLALWVQRYPLAAFFGPDDLIHIEQALGLRAPPVSAWRFLSQVLYFKAMLRIAGPFPPAFHLVSLACHALTMFLLVAVLRRSGARDTMVLLAAGLFGCHPLVYPTMLYAVNINDVLALDCFLIAVLTLETRWPSAPFAGAVVFAVGLFCKESILLLPLVLPLLLAPEIPGSLRLRRSLPVLLVMLGFGVVFAVLRRSGLAPGGAVYAVAFGANTLRTACTYLQWLVSLHAPIPDQTGGPDPRAWLLSACALVAFATLGWLVTPLRRFLVLGSLWFLVGGLPVFVLTHHMYAHYLYVPLVGAAVVAAAAIDQGLVAILRGPWMRRAVEPHEPGMSEVPRRLELAGRGIRTVLAVALLLAYASQGESLIRRRATIMIPAIGWPLDPATRKMVLSGRAVASIAATLPPGATRLVLYSPRFNRRAFGAISGREYRATEDTRGYDLLAEVLDRGTALKIFFPQLTRIEFTDNWNRSLAPGHFYWRLVDCSLVYFGTGQQALVTLAEQLLAQRHTRDALALSDSLAVNFPGNQASRRINALAIAALRDSFSSDSVQRSR